MPWAGRKFEMGPNSAWRRPAVSRAGHGNTGMTLNIYGHNIAGLDDAAATLVDASLGAALEDCQR